MSPLAIPTYASIKAINFMGLVLALAVSLVIPAFYSFSVYYEFRSALKTESVYFARNVESIIQNRPDLWEFETLRLKEITSLPSITGKPEEREIVNREAQSIVTSDYKAPFPYISYSVPLFDSGRPVGALNVRRPFGYILANILVVWAFALISGWSINFFLIRRLSRLLKISLDNLHNEKERIEITLNALNEGVITVDSQGTIILCNNAAQQLIGIEDYQAIGRPISEVYSVTAISDDRESLEATTYQLSAKNGGMREIEEFRVDLHDAASASGGYVLVFRDISERLRIEKDRIRVRQLDSLGILAGGIAHDFNNLLQCVFGYVSLAKLDLDQTSSAFTMLGKAEQSMKQATSLTQQLLTYAKGGKPVKKIIHLQPIIQNAVVFSLSGSNVDFETNYGDLWCVDGDEGQLGQVIQNIVINAVQAMPQGGRIRITALNHPPESQPNGKRTVSISIADTGAGIPKAHLSKIFDPYFTTKKAGNGLGLATAYSIIKNHGGTLAVESRPGSGSTFTITLPAVECVAQQPEQEYLPRGFSGKARILVMDDEEVIRTVALDMLNSLGHDVETAPHGEAALVQYRKALEDGAPFDLVILDLTVKGGMGGAETLTKLKQIDPGVKAVVSSGYSDDETIASHLELGFIASLAKPYTAAELENIIRITL
ncbi:MAG: ATP-binding protein [Deltaproteobacteria bacterium]|nr:ATP-binding protein [Deltaproteobacteria bacterium]